MVIIISQSQDYFNSRETRRGTAHFDWSKLFLAGVVPLTNCPSKFLVISLKLCFLKYVKPFKDVIFCIINRDDRLHLRFIGFKTRQDTFHGKKQETKIEPWCFAQQIWTRKSRQFSTFVLLRSIWPRPPYATEVAVLLVLFAWLALGVRRTALKRCGEWWMVPSRNRCGGFPKWGYHNSWMVYKGKSFQDWWFRGTPISGTPVHETEEFTSNEWFEMWHIQAIKRVDPLVKTVKTESIAGHVSHLAKFFQWVSRG